MITLLRRELTSMALLAQTYAIAAAYIIISGVFFIDVASSSQSADLAAYYSNTANTLLVLCPILAARSLAEERASGALLISLAWPVSRWSLVLSKFIANTLYTTVILSIAWIYYAQLSAYANPEFARALGGWIGLVLLAALYNAVSLAISARAATTVSAAFLSFGVLLFFWVIQYTPPNIAAKLDQFAPTAHFDPMLDGILYTEDVAYFVILSIGALGLAVYAISRRRAGRDRRVMVQRTGSAIGATAVFLATPALAGATSGQLDLTPSERETVSRASSEVIDKIGEVPIEITAFSQPISLEASRLRSTVRKYRAAGANISGRIIDPDVAPALATASGVTAYDTFLIKVGNRSAELDDLVEFSVTSAISELASTELPLACFVQGHGERQLTEIQPEGLASLAARLRIIGYEPAQVFLAGKGAEEFLPTCAVVAMIGPRARLTEPEMATLAQYLRDKGRLVVAADSVRGDIDQLNELLEPWGAKLEPGPIRDPQSLADDPAAIVTSEYTSASPVVDVLNNDDTPVVFANALAVRRTGVGLDPEGPQLAELVMSSTESFRVDARGTRIPESKAAYTLAGSLFAGEITGEGEQLAASSTRIGILGSADVASNRYQRAFGNQEFVIRLLQETAGTDPIITAFREVGENSQFVMTGEQRTALIRQTVVLPSAAALIFVPFVLWRLRRG
ncbi:MAG: Gldg family protein [Sporichthyaceae bacterium]